MDQEPTASGKHKGGQVEPPVASSGNDAGPQEAPAEGQEKEYVIDIFRDWCKGCGICAAFCPRGCIKMNAAGEPVVEKADRCTGCGWCELHCPDFAICVRELAAKKAKTEEAD
jgi:2-oxoglutarate ferredoxin oxidoreductase subunit delta